MSESILMTALKNFPLVCAGDDLCELVAQGLACDAIHLQFGDILVVAQKVVSKAEGRIVNLNTVKPSAEALELAKETQKDPRLVELILLESKSIIRKKTGVIIVEHNRGWIMANAGIDASNVD